MPPHRYTKASETSSKLNKEIHIPCNSKIRYTQDSSRPARAHAAKTTGDSLRPHDGLIGKMQREKNVFILSAFFRSTGHEKEQMHLFSLHFSDEPVMRENKMHLFYIFPSNPPCESLFFNFSSWISGFFHTVARGISPTLPAHVQAVLFMDGDGPVKRGARLPMGRYPN